MNNNLGTMITRLAVVLIFELFAYGCSPMAIESKVDFRKDTDFSAYKSYSIIPNEQDDVINLPLEKRQIDEVITNAIEHYFEKSGLKFEKATPDLIIAYYIVTHTKTDVYQIEDYFLNLGYNSSRSSTQNNALLRETTYEQGILVFDIMDNSTKETIWRGHSESRIGIYKDEGKIQKRLEAAVNKILTRFPSTK